MRRRLAAVSTAALLLTATAACGGSDGSDSADPSSGTSGGVEGVSVSGDFATAPTVSVKGLDVSDTAAKTLITGEGPKVEAGGVALADLYIVNGTTGEKAYSSYDQKKPELVVLDKTKFIPALVPELEGATEGSRVLVTSTVEKAIGPNGASQIGLKKGQDVVFVVDIVAVGQSPSGDAATPSGFPAVETKGEDVTGLDFSSAPKKPSSKLQVETLVEGDGEPITKGANVIVDYFGEVYGGDKPFDESFTKDPTTFPVGVGSLIKGWDEGLIGVKAGSRVLMVVPSDLGYGAKGSPPAIPGDSTLVFVIDVLGVAPAA